LALPCVLVAVKPRSAQQSNRLPPCAIALSCSFVVPGLTPVMRSRCAASFSSSLSAASSRASPPVSATMPSACGSAAGARGKVAANRMKPSV